jgi:hypothetical protein
MEAELKKFLHPSMIFNEAIRAKFICALMGGLI